MWLKYTGESTTGIRYRVQLMAPCCSYTSDSVSTTTVEYGYLKSCSVSSQKPMYLVNVAVAYLQLAQVNIKYLTSISLRCWNWERPVSWSPFTRGNWWWSNICSAFMRAYLWPFPVYIACRASCNSLIHHLGTDVVVSSITSSSKRYMITCCFLLKIHNK